MIDLANEYFGWMVGLINDQPNRKVSYKKLLMLLYDTEFEYSLTMDVNRYEDGIDLRYRFGFEQDIGDIYIKKYLDNRPCSVLEMMVALCMRCEEHIMDNPDIGNRTGKWFWEMIENLGLSDMRDNVFDEYYVRNVIDIFLDREYESNGRGGLFKMPDSSNIDMRKEEIWYQAMWYLNRKLDY